MWTYNRKLYEISHHGIEGQQWGVRNGPPYPLERVNKHAREYFDTVTPVSFGGDTILIVDPKRERRLLSDLKKEVRKKRMTADDVETYLKMAADDFILSEANKSENTQDIKDLAKTLNVSEKKAVDHVRQFYNDVAIDFYNTHNFK